MTIARSFLRRMARGIVYLFKDPTDIAGGFLGFLFFAFLFLNNDQSGRHVPRAYDIMKGGNLGLKVGNITNMEDTSHLNENDVQSKLNKMIYNIEIVENEIKAQRMIPSKKNKSLCEGYMKRARRNRSNFTVSNILRIGSHQPQPDDVTLVTQLGITRLEMLEKILHVWKAPVSATLYITSEDKKIVSRIHHIVKKLQNISYHLQLHILVDTVGYYPVNILRNIALKAAVTEYIFLLDVDFIPSYDLAQVLRNWTRSTLFPVKNVLVVPAFEILDKTLGFPQNKSDLLKQFSKDLIYSFHHHLGYKPHGPTNYKTWKTAQSLYKIEYEEYYEPYIVLRKDDSPLYVEDFVGREFNKISHIMEVHARGYPFYVIPDGFIIHLPHKSNKSGQKNLKCAQKVFGRFKKYLKSTYG